MSGNANSAGRQPGKQTALEVSGAVVTGAAVTGAAEAVVVVVAAADEVSEAEFSADYRKTYVVLSLRISGKTYKIADSLAQV